MKMADSMYMIMIILVRENLARECPRQNLPGSTKEAGNTTVMCSGLCTWKLDISTGNCKARKRQMVKATVMAANGPECLHSFIVHKGNDGNTFCSEIFPRHCPVRDKLLLIQDHQVKDE